MATPVNKTTTPPTTMPTALVAAFDDRDRALRAVDDLRRAGFEPDDFGFVLRGEDVARGGMLTDAEGAKDAKGAVAGAAAGGALGAALAAGAALLIPGIGPVLAGGLLTYAIGGAIAGTAVGGILGALQGLDISEEEAAYYDRAFRAGKALVAVRAGIRTHEAFEILSRHGGYCFQNRGDQPIETEGMFSEP